MWALLVRAGCAARGGELDRSVAHLRGAVAAGAEHDLVLCTMVARRRLGQLLGGDEGAALVAEADRWMKANGVARPERFSEVVAPGFPPGA